MIIEKIAIFYIRFKLNIGVKTTDSVKKYVRILLNL